MNYEYDAVIVGGTPAGIMAGIAVARAGRRAVILERTAHIGGLPANGLGATDIATRGATAASSSASCGASSSTIAIPTALTPSR